MNLNDYQESIKKFYQLEDTRDLALCMCGLMGEAGEVAEKIKKLYRGDVDMSDNELVDDKKMEIAKELGDTLFYLSTLATILEIPMSAVAQTNVDKLQSRLDRDVIAGDGDNR